MRDFLAGMFGASGLQGISSPWTASAALHAGFALYLLALVAGLKVAATLLKGKPPGPARWGAAALWIGLFSFGAIFAVGLQSFVTYRGGHNSPGELYEWYATGLFVGACTIAGVLFYRLKLHEGWRT